MSIKLKNVLFSYASHEIFKDLSIEFKDGVFYSIIAPSGKGKTTLFRLISGLEKPQSGSIEIEGKLSYMFQEDRLFPSLTLWENATIADNGEISAEYVLKKLGIYNEKDMYPDELSGGMRRRVALARALLSPSQNIILDEPFTGLDSITKSHAISLISSVCKDKTLLIATHDDTEREFCNENIDL